MNEKLMTVKELSEALRMSRQTIYNMIHKKRFVLNIHYYKPSPKMILFRWLAVEKWLAGDNPTKESNCEGYPAHETHETPKPFSLINI